MAFSLSSGKFFRLGIKLISFYLISSLLVCVIVYQVFDLVNTGQHSPADNFKENVQKAVSTKDGRHIYEAAWGPSRGLQYSQKVAMEMPKTGDVSVAEQVPDNNFLEDSSDCDTNASGSHIFILAAMRTGSSFLGEIFAQRRDFFYLFEPGRYLADFIEAKNLSRQVLITQYLQIIEDTYRCDFSNSKVLTDGLSNETVLGKKRFAPALLHSKACFRPIKKFKRGRLQCEHPFPVSEITKVCKSKRNVGVKAIRIPDINLLLHLMKPSRTNLKVIHLVRDPRGMAVSRLRVHDRLPDGQLYNATHITTTVRYYVQRYCLSWATNIEIGNYIPWVSTNYKLVRYEDLAQDPLTHTQEIYSFVGLGSKIPFQVLRWIENNTGINEQVNQTNSNRPYSTSRNSRETYEAWRKSVQFDFIHVIQTIGDCKKLMDLAGYLEVPSETALRDPRRSFVTNIPDFTLKKYDFL